MPTAIDEERITMDELLKEHDELLSKIPDGVAHDTANCPICNLEGEPSGANENDDPEGGDMSKTYTEDEFNAAVAAAIEPLQSELDTIKASKTEQEIEARIAEAVATVEAEKAELQKSLDSALVEASESKAALTDLTAFLEAEVQAAEQAAAYDARKTERLAQVKEVASFTDEHLEANADRWTNMSDEDFAAQIADWKEVANAASKPAGETVTEKKIPAVTAMVASRSEQGTDKFASARQIMRAGLTGNDPRTL